MVGGGPSEAELKARVESLGLTAAIRFMAPMRARAAMALGRVMVIPSRAESLPYVVLETAAAGKPLITTDVGGIPEIYGALSPALIPPGDAAQLAKAIAAAMCEPAAINDTARLLRAQVATSFSVETMVDGVLAGYEQALARLAAPRAGVVARA